MIIQEDDYLMHYGILRKSGRYPWGSGETQEARNKSFLDTIDGLKKSGMSEAAIANGFGITTTQLRATKSIAKNAQKQADINQAQQLKNKGLSNIAIGDRMGINESSVRSLLAPGVKDKADILQATSAMLREQVEQKSYIDIGAGVENQIGVSRQKLDTAVAALQEEGYKKQYVKVPQLGTGNFTTIKVLTKPDVPYSEVYANRDKIQQIANYSQDGGRNYAGIKPALSISSDRIGVNYKETGGADADGVIYIRPGVKDVSIGGSRYAQVRVAVDGTHYLKGMAIYKDDLPEGKDIVFNTNKNNTGNKLDAMKPMVTDKDGKVDLQNPFGASISRQILDEKGEKSTSAMNIVNDEGDWDKWSRTLSTQFLSKQNPTLAKAQLDVTLENRKNDLDDILKLTNPTVRKKLLESYADDADSAAVHLKAAALPRQASHVILPVNTLKETEIYAPNYRNGERVVLVRHPHGGTFEIPELTVNNNHPEAKKLLGQAKDAVGINAKVAERLSGADFDGDTVLVIPNGSGKIKTTPALEGLKNFDPKAEYPAYEGMTKITPQQKQTQMGLVSNLITDMTIRGANSTELAAAVRHSMVVIDAEKHNLDYKSSAIKNNIPSLMKKYQGRSQGGSSTLISKATSPVRVAERKARSAAEGGAIDKTTGKKVFTPTGNSFVDRNGRTVLKTEKSKKLAETDDAHTLSSGTKIESVYADYSNRVKDLANSARKEAVNTKGLTYSPSAKAVHHEQVASLNAKLNLALRNAPLERQAQVIANAIVAAKRQANPEMESSELKKIKSQALTEARIRTGAGKTRIAITQDEWDAIQAGAISNHKLTQILNNADLDQVKKLATPRENTVMTTVKLVRAKQMLASGYTQSQVADALGVNLSTLKSSVEGGSNG